jgi:hypothetical protein
MKWNEQIWHRMKHPLYRPEVKMVIVMFLLTLGATSLMIIFPSFMTGLSAGVCFATFLISAYTTLFD